jgi:GNAT superfamily N-acetyltransferase
VTEVALVVREASHDDSPAVAALAAGAAAALDDERGGVLHRDHDLADFDPTGRIGRAGGGTLVGLIDGALLGYACVETVEHRQAVMRALYVDPEAREVGLGESLMEAVLDWCRANGCVGVDATALPGDRETKNFFETNSLVARAIIVHRDLQ